MQHASTQRKNSAPPILAQDVATPRGQRDAEHVHTLGPRATTEAFDEIGRRTGRPDIVREVLSEYRRLARAQVAVALGGRQFPPHVFEVPR